ncbi:haloacid dehalogenase type II [Dyadobacter jejuensis]|nr:haloacid dehalogenase type II [Dyadobacter jejuensis]
MMTKNRRSFIKNMGGVALTSLALPQMEVGSQPLEINSENLIRPKVLYFDVNETLLDLTVMKKSVGDALGGRADLLPLWFTTMLQYSLVVTVGRQYDDFGVIGAAALRMVAANNGITLSEKQSLEAILEPLRALPAHPEVKNALAALKKDGYKLVSFTNSSYKGVKTQFENAGLIEFFDDRLSIEDIGKFKPHADAYNWAARKMAVKPKECLLVAAHGWDIAGALWAGWRGAFVSRPGAQLYPLAPKPEMIGPDLSLLTEKLTALPK